MFNITERLRDIANSVRASMTLRCFESDSWSEYLEQDEHMMTKSSNISRTKLLMAMEKNEDCTGGHGR